MVEDAVVLDLLHVLAKKRKNVGPHCVGSIRKDLRPALICFPSVAEVWQAGQRMPPFLKQLIPSGFIQVRSLAV